MTDNKIIKALEEKVEYPHYYEEGQMLKNVLDLINRQKAEIDSLNNQEMILICQLAEEREKAIKEFAEMLKQNKHECGCNYRKKPVYAVTEEKIDNILSEMESESNA